MWCINMSEILSSLLLRILPWTWQLCLRVLQIIKTEIIWKSVHCYSVSVIVILLKCQPAYSTNSRLGNLNKFSSKCDMVTSLLIYHKCLEIRASLEYLGTDIKLTLSFLSAKSLCWWKWVLSYFKTQKLWSKDNLNTNGWGLSSDVDKWFAHR